MNYRAHRSSKSRWVTRSTFYSYTNIRTFFISTIPLAPPRKFVLSWEYHYIDIRYHIRGIVFGFEFWIRIGKWRIGAPLLRVCRRFLASTRRSTPKHRSNVLRICACRTRCRLPLCRRVFIIWREYLRASGGGGGGGDGGHTAAAGFMATRTRFQLRNLERANYSYTRSLS